MGDRVGAAASADAAGAARQYSGTVGGVALCQVAVTVTYATGRGHALIGRALYLPEGCAADDADEEHRELAGVRPEGVAASVSASPRICRKNSAPVVQAMVTGHSMLVGLMVTPFQRRPAAYKKYGPVQRAP